MWIVECRLPIMIVGPLSWQGMGDDGFASPLYSMRMKRCGLLSLGLQAGREWAMDLRFPSVFSEDETM